MSDEGSAFWMGLVVSFFLLLVFWHAAEGVCQSDHHVADCEWSRTPFTPASIAEIEGESHD